MEQPVRFEGEEPDLLDKILNLSFLYPSSWRLRWIEFSKEGTALCSGNDAIQTFAAGRYRARIDIDAYNRRKVTVRDETGRKAVFFETLMNYSEEDFNEIIRLLGASESSLMNITKALQRVRDSFSRRSC